MRGAAAGVTGASRGVPRMDFGGRRVQRGKKRKGIETRGIIMFSCGFILKTSIIIDMIFYT
jgi:hypothetical protein